MQPFNSVLLAWCVVTMSAFAGTATAFAADPTATPRSFRDDATALVLVDRATGRTLFEQAAHRRLPPASLTKVMTALVALESGRMISTVTIGPDAISRQSPVLGLQPGDRFQLGDLVLAMLMRSANDACRAVAFAVGGGEPAFVELMNRKAVSLGLTDTHFSNACGFDGPDHYSSAADLARLAQAALAENIIAISMRTEEKEIRTVDGARTFVVRNHTLDETPFTMAKTGFTSRAGHCLIAVDSRDGRSLLLVGLNFRRRWQGALELFQYGFDLPPPAAR
jgi:D-alanyl-D-alanine carboxypeptidase (penicillin-binding protein 5/6)